MKTYLTNPKINHRQIHNGIQSYILPGYIIVVVSEEDHKLLESLTLAFLYRSFAVDPILGHPDESLSQILEPPLYHRCHYHLLHHHNYRHQRHHHR